MVRSVAAWDLPGKKWEGRITNGHKDILGGDEYIHYFDYDDGFTGAGTCQNSSHCAFTFGAV